MAHTRYESPPMQDFLHDYCNWAKPSRCSLSFDIDFVPDFMIQHLLSLLHPYPVKATFFVTHPTEMLSIIEADDRYELALHPFNSPSSTQGSSLMDIVTSLRALAPSAVGNRFHRLQHSYGDLAVLKQHGVRYDSSSIRFNTPYLVPAYHADLDMTLITYGWEDGTCEATGFAMDVASIDMDSPGFKHFAFHPLNIYLNSSAENHRRDFLKTVNNQLTDSVQEAADSFIQKGQGAGHVLRQLLEVICSHKRQTNTLSEIDTAFRAAYNG